MVFPSDGYHRIKEMQPQAQQQRACVKCHSAHVLVLEQRQLVVCGSCEYVAPVGQESATTPRLHNATLLIYDRPVLHIFLSCTQHIKLHGKPTRIFAPRCDWESGIADALTWVKEAQENGRVLLLMTPHALRRPDGYCLNEIARASSLKLNIFPVLVCDSEPPQSISMLPYFDLQSSLPRESPMAATEWDDLVATSMTSIPFQTKVLKLTGLLEAVRTYAMVTAIGGLDNLHLFHGGPTDTIDDTRTPKYRKVLSPKHPCPSLHQPPTSAILDATPQPQATRYVFVFDDTSAPLALKLHADLTAQGVCLNDISAGMASGVGFVPVMVRPCEIPLSICRIQWLDLSDCLMHQLTNNNVVNDVKYAVRLPQVLIE
ncbi:hypothetical protein DYB35_001397 [Aphanomyces astaci]|uniref:TIR domain-containing protein n=1 Tax=Aphanomyces astaci TaxID=112090 RepID=A0A3R6XGR3_APHAT|nr:hypothetical protein DYB35_001397 [Aphanomyces astaci]